MRNGWVNLKQNLREMPSSWLLSKLSLSLTYQPTNTGTINKYKSNIQGCTLMLAQFVTFSVKLNSDK